MTPTHQISSDAPQINSGAAQINSGAAQISSGIAQISSGAARIVSNCVELNIFIFWDGSTLNHFVIYHFDEKYQCLLIKYKLTLFQKSRNNNNKHEWILKMG